jgi:hypothetical protein
VSADSGHPEECGNWSSRPKTVPRFRIDGLSRIVGGSRGPAVSVTRPAIGFAPDQKGPVPAEPGNDLATAMLERAQLITRSGVTSRKAALVLRSRAERIMQKRNKTLVKTKARSESLPGPLLSGGQKLVVSLLIAFGILMLVNHFLFAKSVKSNANTSLPTSITGESSFQARLAHNHGKAKTQ